MKKRNNKIIVLVTVSVIFIVALLIFILNYSKDDSSFSLLEKKWLNDNENNVIDVSVYNDVSIFGDSGSGVIFDYLDNFTNEYGISFNRVSYMSNNSNNSYKDLAFKILKSDEKLSENDILLYEDNYVIVSKNNETYNKIEDLSNSNIGVLASDISLASYYLSEAENLSYKNYDDIELMIGALANEEIENLLLPFNQYLEIILENDLNIVYHLSDINKKYVLTVNDNKTLLSILEKYTYKYKEEFYDETYKTNFVNLFFRTKEIIEEEQMGYNDNSYVYGYVTNIPFETKEDEYFGGILSNYLSGFEDLFDVDFRTVRYDSIEELSKAFSAGEVDMVFGNFNTNGINIDRINTNSLFDEEYVILSKDKKYLNSIRSLKDQDVFTVANTYLFNYLNSNGIVVKGYSNTDELIRNIDNNWTIAMDLATYNYYKNQKLSTFNVIYKDSLNNEYSFVIRDVNKNTTFATLFNFYSTTVDYNEIKYEYNISDNYLSNGLSNILKYLIIGIVLILIISGIIYRCYDFFKK